MKTTKKGAATQQEDHLEYVRRRLGETEPSGLTRVAADAEVSVRTLYNIRDRKSDGQYSTVLRLHEVLKASEAQAGARK